MTVNRIEYWKVVVPCKPGSINSPGIDDPLQRHDPDLASFDLGHKWIVRIHSSTGHTGIGESGRSETEAAVKACASALFSLPQSPAAAAFEIALLDLTGKVLGVPVHQLLGGKKRDRVPLDY